jgi:hypothetical protein
MIVGAYFSMPELKLRSVLLFDDADTMGSTCSDDDWKQFLSKSLCELDSTLSHERFWESRVKDGIVHLRVPKKVK